MKEDRPMSEPSDTAYGSEVPRASPLVIAVMPTAIGLPFWVYVAAFSFPLVVVLGMLVAAIFNPNTNSRKFWIALPTVCSMLFLLCGAGVVGWSILVRIVANPVYSLEHDASVIAPDSKIAMRISELWTCVWRLPNAGIVRDALLQEGFDDSAWPVFLALGVKKIPAQPDQPSEPDVISPGQNFEKSYHILLLALIGLVLLFASLRLVPALRQFNTLQGHIPIALLICLRWVWVSWIDVKYLRLAPGMIEVLHYRWFSKTPRVRSYPIAPGTLVVLQHPTMGSRLLLSRAGQEDRISFSGIYDPKPTIERIWQAVRSTLPTPPLSKQGLIG